jgi:hypothetical protein
MPRAASGKVPRQESLRDGPSDPVPIHVAACLAPLRNGDNLLFAEAICDATASIRSELTQYFTEHYQHPETHLNSTYASVEVGSVIFSG